MVNSSWSLAAFSSFVRSQGCGSCCRFNRWRKFWGSSGTVQKWQCQVSEGEQWPTSADDPAEGGARYHLQRYRLKACFITPWIGFPSLIHYSAQGLECPPPNNVNQSSSHKKCKRLKGLIFMKCVFKSIVYKGISFSQYLSLFIFTGSLLFSLYRFRLSRQLS